MIHASPVQRISCGLRLTVRDRITLCRRVVVGIGNPDRGDDAAGRAVVGLLRNKPPDGVDLLEQDGETTALLACLEGASTAFLVDACESGARAGTVQRFDVAEAPLPQAFFRLSTHGMGLAEAIELARALGQLPPRCVVYAIEGSVFEVGDPLSPSVATAIAAVAAQLRCEVANEEDSGEQTHA
jgi:hydrogenase maturation protease